MASLVSNEDAAKSTQPVSNEADTKEADTNDTAEDNGEDDSKSEGEDAPATGEKKKKKKKKKKKSGGGGGKKPSNKPECRLLGDHFTDYYVANGQTEPPTIPIADLYKKGSFPIGEIQEYDQEFNRFRMTSEEMMAKDQVKEDYYDL